MMRNSLVVAGFGAVVALGLIGYGCSSSNGGGTGTGGHTGTGGSSTTGNGGSATGAGGSATGAGGSATGAGGSATGTGGSATGTGGSTGGGTGGSTGGPAVCAAPFPTSPGDGTACTIAGTCTKNCGPNTGTLTASRPQKPCTCPTGGGVWACASTPGACVWPTDLAAMACFKLTPTPPACPMDTTDGGSSPIKANVSVCTLAGGTTCGSICGSPTVNSYVDTNNAAHMGYCVCIAGKYQCASAAEWAPQ